MVVESELDYDDPPESQPELITVLQRVKRALRQELRVQDAHRAMEAGWERIGGRTNGTLPPSLEALDDQLADEIYYFIVAAGQAIKAREVFVALGHAAPTIRNDVAITAWRDVGEHWDDPITKGRPIRALERWAIASAGGPPGGHWSFGIDGISDLSGVSMPEFRQDLEELLVEIERVNEELFEFDWLDEARAASHLELDAIPSSSPCSGLWWMNFPDKGDRYNRSWLDHWLLCMERVRKSLEADAPPD